MKRVTLIACFIFLMLISVVPVTAVMTVTSISPSTGYANGDTVAYTIVGVNFTNSEGSVWLKKGESTINADVTSWSPTTIECTIKITTSRDAGTWNLIVRQGAAAGILQASKPFMVIKEITLTSITPESGQAGNDSVAFSLVGTGLSDVSKVYLYNEDYGNITADDIDVVSSTRVKGTFDLSDEDEDTYDVCVKTTYNSIFCDLSFDITTDEVGSIDVSSKPTGAQIYVDGTLRGTTPDTVDDLIVGSHRLILRKSGYEEWGKMVTVEADETTSVEATLYAVTTYTATPPPTTWITARPTTARTTAKSTIKVPTTWAYVPTTPASPLDPLVVIGATGAALGLVLLRRW